MPTIVSIQLHPEPGKPLTPAARARALFDMGLEGDSHSRQGPGRRRQVLLLDESTLNDFGLRPGDLREQITVSGLPDVSQIAPGTRLQAGDVLFEAVGDCEPCLHIGALLGVEDPELFRQALQKRRGLLCRVVKVTGEGWVSTGDSITVLPLT